MVSAVKSIIKKLKPKRKLTVEAKRKLRNKNQRQKYAAKKRELERLRKIEQKKLDAAAKKKRETAPPATEKIFGRKGVGARAIEDVEGAGLDPVTGRSVRYARKAGIEGERVTTRAGTPTRGFLKETETSLDRSRAKRMNRLEDKEEVGTITDDEQDLLDLMRKDDADALRRQQSGRSPPRVKQEDVVNELMQQGVLFERATPNQIAQAERNIEARKALETRGSPSQRRIAEATAEAQAARVRPRARHITAGLRAEDVGGMNVGGMKGKRTRAQQKKMTAFQEYAQRLKKAKRAKQKKKRRSYATATPTIRGRVMEISKGSLIKSKHTDYRKSGLFYKKGK